MKKLLTAAYCVVAINAHAQLHWDFNFDSNDTLLNQLLSIDITHYPHNHWQLGAPHKAVFNSPYSASNVLVTDTADQYHAGDTSVVVLKVPVSQSYAGPPFWSKFQIISFYYRLDIDSNATANFEISIDNGLHWDNIRDSLPQIFGQYLTHYDTTAFDSPTPGWRQFILSTWLENNPYSDSIWFRFSLLVNSSASPMDGWEIDNLNITYWTENIPTIRNDNLVAVYPNPSSGCLYVSNDSKDPGKIAIYDLYGRNVYTCNSTDHIQYLDLQLEGGVYILRYSTAAAYCIKRIVINR